MRTGIRFTCLNIGDPLLGQTWEYKTLTGVDAVEQKLVDMFYVANSLRVTDVIDTVNVGFDSDGLPCTPSTGVNGDLWPLARRLEVYRTNILKYKLNLVLEVEFPTVVVDENVELYADYVVSLIRKYPWVNAWQVMTQPEALDEAGMVRCSPLNYVRLMRRIFVDGHLACPDVKIGGPGILEAITEYVNSETLDVDGALVHSGWLATATGEFYGTSPQFSEIGKNGFLDYVDFFAFQGRQNYQELNFGVYQQVITKLRRGLVAQTKRTGGNLNIPFLSTYQGHYADRSNFTDMQLQGYRDLREYMNAFAVNVVPFKAQLVDEFHDPDDTSTQPNYMGILYYYLTNGRKPAYTQFKFILELLSDYTRLADNTISVKNKRPYEEDQLLTSVMLMNADGSKLCTIIYPVLERDVMSPKPRYTTVVLKGGLNRKYHLPDGTNATVMNPVDIVLKNYDFVVVTEEVEAQAVVTEDLKTEVSARFAEYRRYATELLQMIPDTYPKGVPDVNFVKLLRSAAVELGDSEYERSILEDNMYLQTAHGDAIYNNFGAMINVKWQKRWTEEQYRAIVSGIIESLLAGATKQSITKAIKLFTSFEVKVYELFSDYEHYGLTTDSSYENQYTFTVEIEKPIEDTMNVDDLYSDVTNVVNIVKPAHTIPVVMIVLVGSEDYPDWYEQRYGRRFSDSDEHLEVLETNDVSNTFGWKHAAYDVVQKTSTSTTAGLNGVLPLGPRYTLADLDRTLVVNNVAEHYAKPLDDWLPEGIFSYADAVTKHPEDVLVDAYGEFLEREVRYGWRMPENVFHANGWTSPGLTNVNVYGLSYLLRDELQELFQIWYDEQFRSASETLEVLGEFNLVEAYHPVVEDESITVDLNFHELKFGLVPGDPRAMYTFGGQPLTTVGNHLYGVRSRLRDELLATLNITHDEQYARALDSVVTEGLLESNDVFLKPFEATTTDAELVNVEVYQLPTADLDGELATMVAEETAYVSNSVYQQQCPFTTWSPTTSRTTFSATTGSRFGTLHLQEKFSMKLFTIDAAGNEVVLQQSMMM